MPCTTCYPTHREMETVAVIDGLKVGSRLCGDLYITREFEVDDGHMRFYTPLDTHERDVIHSLTGEAWERFRRSERASEWFKEEWCEQCAEPTRNPTDDTCIGCSIAAVDRRWDTYMQHPGVYM